MLKSSYELMRVFGIPIKLDLSLIVLVALLVMQYGNPFYGIFAGIALLASITLHELGHSLTARAFGCRVRDITLMMLGGRATLLAMPRKAWQEFLVAAAGPAVSLLLALIGVLVPLLSTVGPLAYGSPGGVFLFYQVGMLNAALCVFNLLPAFPMDGGRILRAFLQHFFMSRLKATWVASRIGRFIAVLLGLSVVFSFLSGKWHGFMFIRLLIAYYIFRAADQEYRQVLYESQGESIFGNFRSPNEDEAVVSPPPYGSKREWRDVHRM